MRLRVRLPALQVDSYPEVHHCPETACGSEAIQRWGKKRRAIEDLHYKEVVSQRYRCSACGRTWWVHPIGVSNARQSLRLKAQSVLLYALGLSYGAVADFLRASGAQIGRTSSYYNVQAAGGAARQAQKQRVADGGKRTAIGADGTYVRVKGALVGVEVVVDPQTQELLGLDLVVSEKAEEISAFIRGIAQQVGAEVLISDDLDSYKTIADEGKLAHQICHAHVIRNTDALVDSIRQQIETAGIYKRRGVVSSQPQLEKDCLTLQWLVRDQPPDATQFLAHLYERYRHAPTPKRFTPHPPEYRFKMAITRLWNRWERLTAHRHFPALDRTNNACERVIGWWIKERYRAMRGYKRLASIRNVATLTATLGATCQPFDMATLF